MRDLFSFLTFVAYNVIFQQKLSFGLSDEDVIQKILSSIDQTQKIARPSKGVNQTVNVEFSIELIHLLDFDEKNQLLATLIWKHHIWRDERLSWNVTEFGGITEVTLPPSIIWTPEIVLYNSAEIKHTNDYSYNIQVTHEGMCKWVPGNVYKSFCEVNMEDFPFDKQKCYLKFGLWAASENLVNLTLPTDKSGFGLNEYMMSLEWDITDTTVKRSSLTYACCTNPYVDITFHFVLQRNSQFYTQFLLVPVLLLSLMVLIIFWIPPTRPDRTGLGMSLLSSFMLLLLLVAQLAPPSKSIKLISYCCCNIILIAAATLLSTIVVNLTQQRHPCNYLPNCCTALNNLSSSNKEKRNPVSLDAGEDNAQHTQFSQRNANRWIHMAFILDKIFFFLYAILTICFAILYLIP